MIDDIRIAAIEGDLNRAVLLVSSLSEKLRIAVIESTGVMQLFTVSWREMLLNEVLYLALEGELDVPAMPAVADVIEQRLPYEISAKRFSAWRDSGELAIRDAFARVEEEPWSDVLQSLVVRQQFGDRPLWKNRLLDLNNLLTKQASIHDRIESEWLIPLGDPVPQYPIAARSNRSIFEPSYDHSLRNWAGARRLLLLSDIQAHATAAALRICAYRAEHDAWPVALTDALTQEQMAAPYHGGVYGYTPLPESDSFELRFPDDAARFEEILGQGQLTYWGREPLPGYNIIRQRPEIDERAASRLLEELGEKPTFVEEKEPMP